MLTEDIKKAHDKFASEWQTLQKEKDSLIKRINDVEDQLRNLSYKLQKTHGVMELLSDKEFQKLIFEQKADRLINE